MVSILTPCTSELSRIALSTSIGRTRCVALNNLGERRYSAHPPHGGSKPSRRGKLGAQLAVNVRFAGTIDAMDPEHRLRDVEFDHANLRHGRVLFRSSSKHRNAGTLVSREQKPLALQTKFVTPAAKMDVRAVWSDCEFHCGW